MVESKTCTHCGTEKPLAEFYQNRLARDGHASWCKSCQIASARENYSRRRAVAVAQTPPPNEAVPQRRFQRNYFQTTVSSTSPPGLLNGTIRQVLREGRKQSVGDRMGFKAGGRSLPEYGIHTILVADAICIFPNGVRMDAEGRFLTWEELSPLAKRLGVEPPTGEGLRDFLLQGPSKFPRVPAWGLDAQILGW
jgi:hypothetical protein